MASSSEALLQAWRRDGDVAAIGALFDREAPGLYRLALTLCRDPATAEDVLQETFLAALDGLEAYDARRPVGPYLVGILKNMARRARRDESRRPDPARLSGRTNAEPAGLDDDERAGVRRAIDVLDEPYRSVALLHYVHGLGSAEIAHLRSEPPGTVRSTLARARERLRGRLPALVAVRATVMHHATTLATTSIAAPILGGLLVGKKLALAAAALAVVLVAGGFGFRLLDPAADVPAPPPELRADVAAIAAASLKGAVDEPGSRAAAARTASATAARGLVRDADGNGIQDARVLAVPEATLRPASWEDVETGVGGAIASGDSEGRFAVELDPVRPAHTLLVEAPGFAPVAVRTVTPGEEVRVVLGRPARLEGRVVNQDGEPVVGATVTFLGTLDATAVMRRAVSDDAGRYVLAGLPVPGVHRPDVPMLRTWLRCEAAGYAPLRHGGDVMDELGLAAGATTTLDFTMLRGARIAGRLLDAESDAPLGDGRMLLIDRDGSGHLGYGAGRTVGSPWDERRLGQTSVDAVGAFGFDHVASAGGRLVAIRDGYVSSLTPVPTPDDGGTIAMEIRLWPAATVRGRVVDGDGRGVERASVYIENEERKVVTGSARIWSAEDLPQSWATTDASGRFEVRGVPALKAKEVETGMQLWGPARPWQASGREVRRIRVRAGQVTDVGDVLLVADENLRLVRIRVLDADEHPVPDAGVGSRVNRPYARTDAEGVATLTLRADLGAQTFFVSAAGHAVAQVTLDPEATGDTEVRLEAPRRIAGRVRLSEGGAEAGIWVLAALTDRSAEEAFADDALYHLPGAGPMATAGTDADGFFELEDLPAGPLHLLAIRSRVQGGRVFHTRAIREAVPAGTTNLEIVMPPLDLPSGGLDVFVLDAASEEGLEDAIVYLRGASGRRQPTASEGGHYHFELLEPGAWQLHVHHPGYGRAEDVAVEIADDAGLDEIFVALGQGHRLHGHVTADTACGDVTGWFVRAVPVEGGTWADNVMSKPIEADGAYRLTGLAEGDWYVSLLRPGRAELGPGPVRSEARPIRMDEGNDEIDLDLHFVAGGFLRVHLVDARLPAKNAKAVLAIHAADGRLVASSPVEGKEAVPWVAYLPLPPGRYEVRLLLPGEDEEATTANVIVAETTEVRVGREE